MSQIKHPPRVLIGAALLVLTVVISFGSAADLAWDNGAFGDQKWSSADNWDPSDADVSGDDLYFGNNGASSTQSTVTSVVDGDVNIGALTFGNLSGSKRANDYFHTLQINDGKTLTVGSTFTLGIDTRDTAPNTTDTVVTMTGQGTLAFDNSAANFNVGNYSGDCCGQNRRAILDMGGLSNFTLDANRLNLGRVGAANPEAVLTLAQSNDLTADALDIGQWNDVDNVLELGEENSLHFNDIFVAWGTVNAVSSTIRFDSGLTDPEVTIRGRDSERANLYGAKMGQARSNATIDLTGGSVDAKLNKLRMGRTRSSSNHNGDGTGTFSFDAGTVDLTTVTLGIVTDPSVSSSDGRGTVDIGGTGQLIADSIVMGEVAGGAGKATARVNLNGGTLAANTIAKGTDLGSGSHVRQVNVGSGTVRPGSSGALHIGADVGVIISGSDTSLHADAGQSITIDGVVSGTGGFRKTGNGSLHLNGTNTYSGTTVVAQGTLGGNGQIGGPVEVQNGAAIGPGNSIDTLTVGETTFGNGSTYVWEFDETSADLLHIQGNLVIEDDFTLDFVNLGDEKYGDFDLITYTGTFTGDPGAWTIDFPSRLYGDVVASAGAVRVTGLQAPEPTAGCLIMLGCLGILLTRHRRWNRSSCRERH